MNLYLGGEIIGMARKTQISVDYTSDQLLKLDREDLIEDLTDREIAFAENYIKDYNIKLAAIRAGCTAKSANVSGLALRRKARVNNYIAWLKLQAYQKANVDALDILNFYAKAAFSDISDYVEIVNNGRIVKIKPMDEIDGQLIQELSQNAAGGISFKLIDKMAALNRLENYMDTNPYDWKRKIEERKLGILEERLELERKKFDPFEETEEDDGLIAALVKASKGIFEEEEPEDEE